MFAKVILPNALNKQFNYRIPAKLNKIVSVGSLVVIQFGKNKQHTGIVWSITLVSEHKGDIKDILDVLDDYPLISKRQMIFWEWISDYYICSLGDVFKAAVPSSFRLESEMRIFPVNTQTINDHITEKEILVLDELNGSKYLTLGQIKSITGLKSPQRLIQQMVERGLVAAGQSLNEKYKPKLIKYYVLNPSLQNEQSLNVILDGMGRAPGQERALLRFLEIQAQRPQIPKKELREKEKISEAILKALEKKNVLQVIEEEISRLDLDQASEQKHDLNQLQNAAFESIKTQFKEKTTVLLHGVTSSGKTEIYIHLIEQYISEKKQVLYLLPEIALTTQMVMRLKRVFGEKVLVYHSQYSDSQRAEVFKKVRNFSGTTEDGYIVLGARSSVLLPFQNLGLVIVDEEHEHTYKQLDPAPRYHARDAAIVLAGLCEAKILLGTATPSLESYHNAQSGKFGLTELVQRHNQVQLPEIKTIDLVKAEKKKQMHTHFSSQLLAQMNDALGNQEQIILFQNRRGYAPYLECFTCNWIPYCENCDVSLTYHQKKGQVICHYCGYARKVPHHCDACGELNIQTRGFGTEKIEDELKIIFPKANMQRLDLDSARSKNAFEQIIHGFEDHEIDVLVGTQMVTKGLDFDNVKLVGIMNADGLLNYPDFRSGERSFQLMSQVSGRAGRKKGKGLVIIQTSQTKHPIIQYVINHDYQSMYNHEIEERELFKYPPFYRLINIRLKSKNQVLLKNASKLLFDQCQKALGDRVVGPEDPLVSRVQNWHQKNILIKLERSISHKQVRNMLRHSAEALLLNSKFKGKVMVIFDVDPY